MHFLPSLHWLAPDDNIIQIETLFLFYTKSVSHLFQEHMASRPIVPQNHDDMADSLFFIS